MSSDDKPERVRHDPARAVVDAFYRAREASPTLSKAFRDAAGPEALPEGYELFNFAAKSELERVASLLQLDSSKLLLEMPCKDGSAGLYLQSTTGCRLLGLDTSPAATQIAAQRAQALGLADPSKVQHQAVPSLERTGLQDSLADAVASFDELWLARNQAAVLKEMARLLKPSGMLALTSWEHYQAAVFVKDPVSDYSPLLQQTGLEVLLYERQPHTMRQAVGQKVMEHEDSITKEMGDMAKFILMEVKMLTGRIDGVNYMEESRGKRVLVVARKPAG